MRNLVLLADSEDALGLRGNVVAAACEMGSELIVLTDRGELSLRDMDADNTENVAYGDGDAGTIGTAADADHTHTLFDLSRIQDDDEDDTSEDGKASDPQLHSLHLHEEEERKEEDHGWFLLTVIAGSGCLVCISHSGKLVSVGSDPRTGAHTLPPVLEGVIDSGIVHAAWSPDQTRLLLLTGAGVCVCLSLFSLSLSLSLSLCVCVCVCLSHTHLLSPPLLLAQAHSCQ